VSQFSAPLAVAARTERIICAGCGLVSFFEPGIRLHKDIKLRCPLCYKPLPDARVRQEAAARS